MIEIDQGDLELLDTANGVVVDAEGYVQVRVKNTGETGKLLLEEAIALKLCSPYEADEQQSLHCVALLEDKKPDFVDQPQLSSPTDGRVIQVWGESETKIMLSLYAENLAQIGPQKPFGTKKALWNFIAGKINYHFKTNYSAIQVEGRLKTILKRTKRSLDSNKVSGATRVKTPYDREVERIIGIDDSILPEITMGAGITKRKNETPNYLDELRVSKTVVPGVASCFSASSSSMATSFNLFQASDENNENNVSFSSSSESSQKKVRAPKKLTVQERFLQQKEKLFKEKQENKERRHRERLEELKSINQTLQKFLNK